MLRNPISLPVFFNTEATETAQNLNIEVGYEDMDIRQTLFFEISAITMLDMDNGQSGTMIFSGGEEFQSPLSLKDAWQIIKEHLDNEPKIH